MSKKTWWQKLLRVELPVPQRRSCSVVVPAVLEHEEPLYRALGGMPVLAHTLLALDEVSRVREVIVVIREAHLKRVADLCRTYDVRQVRKVVCAKSAGLDALAVGVYECDAAEYIAICDPLRPFVTEAILGSALDAAAEAGAGAPTVPVKDTIKIVRDGVVRETPDRDSLHLLQTPQVVESSLLKAALVRAKEAGAEAADLPAALELLGLPLRLTKGSDENIRVAAAADLPAAEAMLMRKGYL